MGILAQTAGKSDTFFDFRDYSATRLLWSVRQTLNIAKKHRYASLVSGLTLLRISYKRPLTQRIDQDGLVLGVACVVLGEFLFASTRGWGLFYRGRGPR